MSPLSKVRAATRRLCGGVAELEFGPPVTHVYNPLEYASRTHGQYLAKYAATPKRVIFLGMNPGPFGMAQTGVPFGEIAAVRDWLGIEGRVDAPEEQHPKRPIEGFACARAEVSGARLWGGIADHFGTPDRFFANHFIANYCPLVFMEETGRNRTPDKLAATEREPLFALCDAYLRAIVRALEPEWVIGIGAFAEQRARLALADEPLSFGRILHPSPANPRANSGWAPIVESELRALGVCPGRSQRRRAS